VFLGHYTKRELDQKFDDLRREWRVAQADWEEWYDRFRRLYARLTKRVKDAEKLDGGGSAEAPGSSGDAGPTADPSWMSSLDPVSRDIMRKRLARGLLSR
jgi:hypothetical protein